MEGTRRKATPHMWSIFACAAVMTLSLARESPPAFAAGDASAGSCPSQTESSPGFRTSLPDCRAYEMVTPLFTGSGLVRHLTVFQLMSPDGSHLLGTSFGGFAGTENNEENEFPLTQAAMYEFSRTPTGWLTEALAPPASQYSHSAFVAASSDLSRSLWAVTVQPQPNEEVIADPESTPYAFVLREPGGGGQGRFTTVGPRKPAVAKSQRHAAFEGASGDLSRLVYGLSSGENELWPGDATRPGTTSIYEYEGTGKSEPVLIAVKNAGALHGVPHINEGAELISECGAELGGGKRGSMYNAISRDGAIIYFTALHEAGGEVCSTPAVDEVYARIDGSRTVPISQYHSPECTATCAAAPARPAVFQGASEAGASVFFTTEQPLLNSDGDGTNDLYMAELGETGVVRVAQVSKGDATDATPGSGADVVGVTRISADGSHVYFVARGVLTTAMNDHEAKAEAGGYNLYVYNTTTGETAFIATLVTNAEFEQLREAKCVHEEEGFFKEQCEKRATGEAEQLEAQRADAQREDQRVADTTPDGRFLIFLSTRQLTGAEDKSTVNQAFEYDAATGTLARVSAGQKSAAFPDGYNENGNTSNDEEAAHILRPNYIEDYPGAATSSRSVAEDGTVFFTSRDALAPSAVPGGRNIYEYRAGNLYLISPGEDPLLEEQTFGRKPDVTEVDEETGRLLGTDQAGDNVFFTATTSLVPEDTNTQGDWYVARIDGGFPAPARPSACQGDACQGPLAGSPDLLSAGSTQQGEGGLTPTPRPPVKPKHLTRQQRLAQALKACRKLLNKKERRRCEAHARKRYATRAQAPRRARGA